MTYAGSCLCGEVRFEIEGAFEGFFLCHCSRCRKGTGSAHASNLFSSTAALRWLSGAEKVKTHHVAGTRHARSFCMECGSAAPRAETAFLVIPAGSLDADVPIQPTAHICCASRANWDDGFEGVPKLDGLPG